MQAARWAHEHLSALAQVWRHVAVARHLIGDALTDVAELRDDPVHRVRTAATRAVTRLTRTGA